MEKFTVDLDKVLDEFEFNEEQAVKQKYYKREDLPATRYQRPHFQPINIADADFSPAEETITPSLKTLTIKNDFNKLTNVLNNQQLQSLEESPRPIEKINNELSQQIQPQESNEKINNDKILEPPQFLNNFEIAPAPVISQPSQEILEVPLKIETQIVVESNETNSDGEDTSDSESEPEQSQPITKDTEEYEKDKQDFKSVNDADGNEMYNSELNEYETSDSESLVSVSSSNSEFEIDESAQENEVDNPTEYQRSQPDLLLRRLHCPSSDLGLPDITVAAQRKELNEPKEVEVVKYSADISDDELKGYLQELEEMEEAEGNGGSTETIIVTDSNENLNVTISNIEPVECMAEQTVEEAEKPTRPVHLEIDPSAGKPTQGSAGSTPMPKTVEFEGVKTEVATEKRDVATEKTEIGNETADNGKNELADVKSESDSEENYSDCVSDNISNEQNRSEGLLDEARGSSGGEISPDHFLTLEERRLGKVSPYWIPDNDAPNCMNCDMKFTVIKRRHHCRACGRVLCSKCCGMRATLDYMDNQEQRVCEKCFHTLAKVMMYELQHDIDPKQSPKTQPNPNNPMEYCSTVPVPVQAANEGTQPTPSVLVPVGVLKREGSSSKSKDTVKQVMFSDGIRPGGDLTELDGSSERTTLPRKTGRVAKRVGTPPGQVLPSPVRLLPPIDPATQSFILEKSLPPVCVINKGEITYQDTWPHNKLMERLKDTNQPPLTFAINRHLFASIQVVKMDCCMNKTCWAVTTRGMSCVGQDEIIILLALTDEMDENIPRDVLLQLHYIYQDAAKGNVVSELGYWQVKESTFLDSRQHGGFLFIRPSFQCLNRIVTPPAPFLIGLLIHRFEIPWAKVFPIRLMLRLGAEMRYYPCPLISIRFREPVYVEIGHTIINLLADFRNFTYTLPNVRGLRIHMESKQTSVLIPRNRYDQVVRALNNSNDPVLALAGCFSPDADSHLVCMQSKGDEVTYHTQAINIHDKPRKVTGASFVVFNGALKTTSGLAAKTSIVEDGLMVQVHSDTMAVLRNKLREMEDWSISCGPPDEVNNEEIVKIVWCDDDRSFNIGVKSLIDEMSLDGVPSIRVHNGTDYMGTTRFIRWTQVFIIKCEDGTTSAKIGDPLKIDKLSESIAIATCTALVKLLDMLVASGMSVLSVRATIDPDNVGYEAGSNGEKLAPIYMKSLDNELIKVLHKAVSVNDSVAILELMFHIMDQ